MYMPDVNMSTVILVLYWFTFLESTLSTWGEWTPIHVYMVVNPQPTSLYHFGPMLVILNSPLYLAMHRGISLIKVRTMNSYSNWCTNINTISYSFSFSWSLHWYCMYSSEPHCLNNSYNFVTMLWKWANNILKWNLYMSQVYMVRAMQQYDKIH